MEKIKIMLTSPDGGVLTVTDSTGDIILTDADGLTEAVSDIVMTENAMTHGSTYQGSRQKERNITLTLRDRPRCDHSAARSLLYTLLPFGTPGLLTAVGDFGTRYIQYYVESISSERGSKSHKYTVSLRCPDPFYEDAGGNETYIGTRMTGAFEFPHAFTAAREEFSGIVEIGQADIINEGAGAAGITITITASETVTNPFVRNTATEERFRIGTSAVPFVMYAGDSLTITTGTGNKHAFLTRGGVSTDVLYLMDPESRFIQLQKGKNYILTGADVGQGDMLTRVEWHTRYEGL